MDGQIISYWSYKTEETYQKGSTFLIVGFFLFIFWAIVETYQAFFLPVFALRISLISIVMFTFLLIRYFYKKNKYFIIPSEKANLT